jgi:hypothetical protein
MAVQSPFPGDRAVLTRAADRPIRGIQMMPDLVIQDTRDLLLAQHPGFACIPATI